MQSGLDLLGIPLKKNAPCYLPQGGVEMTALYHFLATERKNNYFLARDLISRLLFMYAQFTRKNIILVLRKPITQFSLLLSNDDLYKECFLDNIT